MNPSERATRRVETGFSAMPVQPAARRRDVAREQPRERAVYVPRRGDTHELRGAAYHREPWTTTDVTILRENYSEHGAKGVAGLLSRPRSLRAISQYALKLGLKHQRGYVKPAALAALRNGPLTAVELARMVSCSLSVARVTLSALCRRGRVERVTLYRMRENRA